MPNSFIWVNSYKTSHAVFSDQLYFLSCCCTRFKLATNAVITITAQILVHSLANFLLSISGQTHEFIIYAMQQWARSTATVTILWRNSWSIITGQCAWKTDVHLLNCVFTKISMIYWKTIRLLYAGHGIMGLGHVIRQGQAPPQHTLNCTLIQSDGTLKTFSVPFHCALR